MPQLTAGTATCPGDSVKIHTHLHTPVHIRTRLHTPTHACTCLACSHTSTHTRTHLYTPYTPAHTCNTRARLRRPVGWETSLSRAHTCSSRHL